MKLLIVAILDNKANDFVAHGYLFTHRHLATAIRMYTDAMSDPQSRMNKHPEDYDLVQLGYLHESADGSQHTITPAYEILMTGRALAAATAGPTETRDARMTDLTNQIAHNAAEQQKDTIRRSNR